MVDPNNEGEQGHVQYHQSDCGGDDDCDDGDGRVEKPYLENKLTSKIRKRQIRY